MASKTTKIPKYIIHCVLFFSKSNSPAAFFHSASDVELAFIPEESTTPEFPAETSCVEPVFVSVKETVPSLTKIVVVFEYWFYLLTAVERLAPWLLD